MSSSSPAPAGSSGHTTAYPEGRPLTAMERKRQLQPKLAEPVHFPLCEERQLEDQRHQMAHNRNPAAYRHLPVDVLRSERMIPKKHDGKIECLLDAYSVRDVRRCSGRSV